ncbi:exosome non-catalytic core subunit rrp40 [Mucor velutinosus]|uniref:Exosome non-catalytic core subunit rrp40 n=1 Tax=Mucor velutinosus TaxID=708070 RepID=A0AAN7I211_9FUNG|nr:exosome non-catalytic core subunit rrp40 [Mucor velutinosus]
MWQEAKANDKRIRELMVDHRKRAERRRAYYESRLGDPQQLIRVIGSSTKLYPDAEQFYYHENPENLMPWQANPDIKIDRFDGRSLLDFVPDVNVGANLQNISREDRELADELNFERYHDLIEAERLNVTESDRLAEVDEEWTKLLDRHQAKLALLKNDKKSANTNKGKTFGFDYGTAKVAADEDMDGEDDYDDDKESQLLKEADILQYVDDLTDKDKDILNDMSGKYGIRSYARLLRVAKKDRDEELRSLKRKQREGKPKDGSRSSRRNERRRRRHHRRDDQTDDSRYRRRYSPTYEPYKNDSGESSSSEDDDEPDNSNSDFVIEFGSSTPDEGGKKDQPEEESYTQRLDAPTAPVEKKLTPMEKLKLKMRAGLEKSIASNEKDRRQKEREKEAEHLQELAKSQGLPANAYLRPDPPMRDSSASNQDTSSRYRSPSSEGSVSPKRNPQKSNRSPSPKHPQSIRQRSPSSLSIKSSSRDRKRYRSPSPRDETRSRRRSLSRDRYRSHNHSSRDRRRHRHSRSHSHSRSPKRGRRYRSPSVSEDRRGSRKHRYSKSPSPSRQRERGSRR